MRSAVSFLRGGVRVAVTGAEPWRFLDRCVRAGVPLEDVRSEDDFTVTVSASPVISYMRSLHQEPSKYYIEETRTVYETIADETGYGFALEYYNEDGGCRYRIFRRAF